jgi:uroporphyrinogen decarboxylase
MDLGRARAIVADVSDRAPHAAPKALQGNIDPNVLFAPPEAIRAETRRVLDAFGAPHVDPAARGSTHVFNLGHGISQFTPPEHVAHLVDEVHAYSRRLRG